jgi:Tfp pilus assembly protein PilO
MSDTNRLLIAGAALLAVIGGFWFMLLAPKREESTAIAGKVDRLEAQVTQVRQQADAAEEAKSGFADDYEQLVLLGKAVPGDDDTASFLVQLDQIASRSGISFRALQLDDSATAEPAPAPAPVPAAPTDPAAAPTPTAAPATEASAATLPIGATVGAAGLGVMPYNLTFRGKFFEIADFIAGLDALVKTTNGRLDADGRLVTVDGFSLEADEKMGFPVLKGSFAVTTYLTPPGQGVTAGATPVAPLPSTAPPTTTTTTTPAP